MSRLALLSLLSHLFIFLCRLHLLHFTMIVIIKFRKGALEVVGYRIAILPDESVLVHSRFLHYRVLPFSSL